MRDRNAWVFEIQVYKATLAGGCRYLDFIDNGWKYTRDTAFNFNAMLNDCVEGNIRKISFLPNEKCKIVSVYHNPNGNVYQTEVQIILRNGYNAQPIREKVVDYLKQNNKFWNYAKSQTLCNGKVFEYFYAL